MTGTPEGVNSVVRGDVLLHGAIEGLGEITATIAS
jgi:2-keto-4-pentenoate hydratase/2-oxohepta-3-ene-1,7-dioic acid hydratase in catechol pathway